MQSLISRYGISMYILFLDNFPYFADEFSYINSSNNDSKSIRFIFSIFDSLLSLLL